MTAPLELTGGFGGFVFNEVGKRRMLLRQGDHDRLLKVPRDLRRRMIGKFRVGELIRVAITEETDPATGVCKQVVSRVLPPGAATIDAHVFPPALPGPPVSCVVRVCSKKNCWRNGGRELFESLVHERNASGHAASVEIRQVGCLDRCKRAPNAACGNRDFTGCSPREAGAILVRAVGYSPQREPERP